jgi:ATP-dependent DNA helicase RecG
VLGIDEINALLGQDEGVDLEFKQSYDADVSDTFAAFANGWNGILKGTVIFGVTNTKDLIGVKENIDYLQQKIANLCRDACTPPILPLIQQVTINSKPLVVVEVRRSQLRPHRSRGICYVRVGPTTRKATPEVEEHLKQETLYRPFDETTVESASVDEIDSISEWAYRSELLGLKNDMWTSFRQEV